LVDLGQFLRSGISGPPLSSDGKAVADEHLLELYRERLPSLVADVDVPSLAVIKV
jgi:hypothetical protein